MLIMKKIVFSIFAKAAGFLVKKGAGKIPYTGTLYSFLYNKIKPKGIIEIAVEGNKMFVNSHDSGIAHFLLVNKKYEEFETQLFKTFLKPGMVVIDIGANIGYYTLIAAQAVGKQGKVYSFEPEPKNYELLTKNIQVNKFENTHPIQKALSNKSGKIKLYLDENNLGNPSISKNNIPEEKGFVEVETLTLDSFFQNKIKNIDLDIIKIDVQGAEGLVLEGSENILKKNNLKIFMEFWPYGLKNLNTEPLELLRRLEFYGFKIFLINPKKRVLQSLTKKEIIDLCEKTKDGKGFVNLLLEK